MADFRIEQFREIASLVKELATGLRDLTFSDNFKSFEYTATIAANTEVKVRNTLTIKPTKYMIVHQTGNALVTAGDTEWDDNYVYLKNHDSTNAATVTVTFMR